MTSNLPVYALGPGNATDGTVFRILRGCGGGGGDAGPNPGVGGGGGSLLALSSTYLSSISALRTTSLLLIRVPKQ